MLLNTNRMQVMTTGLNALATQQKVILNNLANYETPNFKAKHVTFEEVFSGEVNGKKKRVGIEANIETDDATTVRPDGNNVNADTESIKLYENYVQSLYLYSKVTSEINNYRYVLKQAPR